MKSGAISKNRDEVTVEQLDEALEDIRDIKRVLTREIPQLERETKKHLRLARSYFPQPGAGKRIPGGVDA